MHGRALLRGLRDSLSIVAGYLPVAVSFGLAASHAGMPAWAALLTSLCIYAGASQFILAGLLADGSSAVAIVGIVLLMNLRHMFYGPAVATRLDPRQRRLPLCLLAAGLTDEVFATAIGRLGSQPAAEREQWYAGLQLGAYSAWVLGTAAGVYFGQDLLEQSPLLAATLGFVLPALFFALLLEIGSLAPRRVLVAGALATAVGLWLLPSYGAIIAGMLAAAAMGARNS